MDWGLAGAVTLIGLAVVFAVLLILIFFCWLLGKILGGTKKSGSSDAPKAKKEAAKSAPNAAASDAIQEDESEGVLAAIFAAVACLMQGKPFRLKSIRRVDKNGRNAWNAAGIAENTRAF